MDVLGDFGPGTENPIRQTATLKKVAGTSQLAMKYFVSSCQQ